MDKRTQEEEKNKRIGWLTSIGVQLALLILFYFLIAWREPFPPIPEYGIELGFTSSAGAASASSQPNPVIEETESEEVVESSEEVQEVEAEEPITTESEASDAESQVESAETEVVEAEETASLPVEQPDEPAGQPNEVEEKEEQPPAIDQRAVMPPTASKTEGTSDQKSEGEAESQEVDARALYGNQGSTTGANEGASLSLSGWVWDFKPRPEDTSDQSGKIVYRIVVDQDGYLVQIETVSSTVSPAVERKYRQAVEKLTFSKTGDYKPAPQSSGTITFIIKSK